jgi:5'(3')-deoxyribonucleotidase
MRKQQTLIIDLDDTVVNLREPNSIALNRATSKTIDWTQWNVFDLCHFYQLTWDEIVSILISAEVIEHAVLEPNAKKVINNLHEKFNIVLMTARGWHPSAFETTTQYLQHKQLKYDQLIVVPVNISKSDVITENRLNQSLMFIDDNPHHIQDVLIQHQSIVCGVYDQPWNKQSPAIRFRGWDHIELFINNRIKIDETD